MSESTYLAQAMQTEPLMIGLGKSVFTLGRRLSDTTQYSPQVILGNTSYSLHRSSSFAELDALSFKDRTEFYTKLFNNTMPDITDKITSDSRDITAQAINLATFGLHVFDYLLSYATPYVSYLNKDSIQKNSPLQLQLESKYEGFPEITTYTDVPFEFKPTSANTLLELAQNFAIISGQIYRLEERQNIDQKKTQIITSKGSYGVAERIMSVSEWLNTYYKKLAQETITAMEKNFSKSSHADNERYLLHLLHEACKDDYATRGLALNFKDEATMYLHMHLPEIALQIPMRKKYFAFGPGTLTAVIKSNNFHGVSFGRPQFVSGSVHPLVYTYDDIHHRGARDLDRGIDTGTVCLRENETKIDAANRKDFSEPQRLAQLFMLSINTLLYGENQFNVYDSASGPLSLNRHFIGNPKFRRQWVTQEYVDERQLCVVNQE